LIEGSEGIWIGFGVKAGFGFGAEEVERGEVLLPEEDGIEGIP
jgi:hypothetical protein